MIPCKSRFLKNLAGVLNYAMQPLIQASLETTVPELLVLEIACF